MDTRQKIRLIPLVVMLLLSSALAFGLLGKKNVNPVDDKHIGQNFPNFELASLDRGGEPFSPKLFAGRVAVVNLFASWCEPCSREHDILLKLAQKVNIYGIAWKDTPEKALQYLHDRGNPFQKIGIDQAGMTTVPLALTGVPETFVLDKNGVIAFHYRSVLTQEIVDKMIIPLVNKLNMEKANTANAPAR
jgi:cytochrome c biogenesis protein CcmG/thiol:disulfide interchange protein DsbE